MKQLTGSKLGKRYVKAVYCHLVNLYAKYIMRNARLDEAQAGIKIAGRNINNLRYAECIMRKDGLDEVQTGNTITGININNFRYADDSIVMAESEQELKSLLVKV